MFTGIRRTDPTSSRFLYTKLRSEGENERNTETLTINCHSEVEEEIFQPPL